MSLKQWQENGWIREHQTSAQEVNNLFAIVERDLQDATQGSISADWRFGIAYNAALKLCTVLLYFSGYRPEKALAHYRTIHALPLILGSDLEPDAEYLDACRVKRNTVEYDSVGGVTTQDAEELIDFVTELSQRVRWWVEKGSRTAPS
jgi:hypothetical protein